MRRYGHGSSGNQRPGGSADGSSLVRTDGSRTGGLTSSPSTSANTATQLLGTVWGTLCRRAPELRNATHYYAHDAARAASGAVAALSTAASAINVSIGQQGTVGGAAAGLLASVGVAGGANTAGGGGGSGSNNTSKNTSKTNSPSLHPQHPGGGSAGGIVGSITSGIAAAFGVIAGQVVPEVHYAPGPPIGAAAATSSSPASSSAASSPPHHRDPYTGIAAPSAPLPCVVQSATLLRMPATSESREGGLSAGPHLLVLGIHGGFAVFEIASDGSIFEIVVCLNEDLAQTPLLGHGLLDPPPTPGVPPQPTPTLLIDVKAAAWGLPSDSDVAGPPFEEAVAPVASLVPGISGAPLAHLAVLTDVYAHYFAAGTRTATAQHQRIMVVACSPHLYPNYRRRHPPAQISFAEMADTRRAEEEEEGQDQEAPTDESEKSHHRSKTSPRYVPDCFVPLNEDSRQQHAADELIHSDGGNADSSSMDGMGACRDTLAEATAEAILRLEASVGSSTSNKSSANSGKKGARRQALHSAAVGTRIEVTAACTLVNQPVIGSVTPVEGAADTAMGGSRGGRSIVLVAATDPAVDPTNRRLLIIGGHTHATRIESASSGVSLVELLVLRVIVPDGPTYALSGTWLAYAGTPQRGNAALEPRSSSTGTTTSTGTGAVTAAINHLPRPATTETIFRSEQRQERVEVVAKQLQAGLSRLSEAFSNKGGSSSASHLATASAGPVDEYAFPEEGRGGSGGGVANKKGGGGSGAKASATAGTVTLCDLLCTSEAAGFFAHFRTLSPQTHTNSTSTKWGAVDSAVDRTQEEDEKAKPVLLLGDREEACQDVIEAAAAAPRSCGYHDFASFGAHSHALQCMAFGGGGTLLATASATGTTINVYQVLRLPTAAPVSGNTLEANSGAAATNKGMVGGGRPKERSTASSLRAPSPQTTGTTPLAAGHSDTLLSEVGGASTHSSESFHHISGGGSSFDGPPSGPRLLASAARTAAPSPTAQVVASATSSGITYIGEVTLLYRLLRGGTRASITSIAFSPCATAVAVATALGTCHFFYTNDSLAPLDAAGPAPTQPRRHRKGAHDHNDKGGGEDSGDVVQLGTRVFREASRSRRREAQHFGKLRIGLGTASGAGVGVRGALAAFRSAPHSNALLRARSNVTTYGNGSGSGGADGSGGSGPPSLYAHPNPILLFTLWPRGGLGPDASAAAAMTAVRSYNVLILCPVSISITSVRFAVGQGLSATAAAKVTNSPPTNAVASPSDARRGVVSSPSPMPSGTSSPSTSLNRFTLQGNTNTTGAATTTTSPHDAPSRAHHQHPTSSGSRSSAPSSAGTTNAGGGSAAAGGGCAHAADPTQALTAALAHAERHYTQSVDSFRGSQWTTEGLVLSAFKGQQQSSESEQPPTTGDLTDATEDDDDDNNIFTFVDAAAAEEGALLGLMPGGDGPHRAFTFGGRTDFLAHPDADHSGGVGGGLGPLVHEALRLLRHVQRMDGLCDATRAFISRHSTHRLLPAAALKAPTAHSAIATASLLAPLDSNVVYSLAVPACGAGQRERYAAILTAPADEEFKRAAAVSLLARKAKKQTAKEDDGAEVEHGDGVDDDGAFYFEKYYRPFLGVPLPAAAGTISPPPAANAPHSGGSSSLVSSGGGQSPPLSSAAAPAQPRPAAQAGPAATTAKSTAEEDLGEGDFAYFSDDGDDVIVIEGDHGEGSDSFDRADDHLPPSAATPAANEQSSSVTTSPNVAALADPDGGFQSIAMTKHFPTGTQTKYAPPPPIQPRTAAARQEEQAAILTSPLVATTANHTGHYAGPSVPEAPTGSATTHQQDRRRSPRTPSTATPNADPTQHYEDDFEEEEGAAAPLAAAGAESAYFGRPAQSPPSGEEWSHCDDEDEDAMAE